MPYLPPEIVSHALSFLDPSDSLTVPTLLACSAVSTFFRAPALSSELWTLLAEARWMSGSRRTTEAPYTFYKVRHARDARAVELVTEMTKVTRNRLQLMTEARGLGMDVFERVAVEENSTAEGDPEYWLSRSYWAKELGRAILRDSAREIWQRIVAEDDGRSPESEHIFEEGVIAFTAHRGGDPDTVRAVHKIGADEVALVLASLVTDPGERRSAPPDRMTSLAQVVHAVANYMSVSGLKLAVGGNQHLLNCHFLITVWHQMMVPIRPGATDMMLVAVFCSLVNHLPHDCNVQARPIAFANIMIAAIANRDEPAGNEDWVYINVSLECRLLSPLDLRTMAAVMSAWGPVRREDIQPARTSDLCRRLAVDILSSCQDGPQPTDGDSEHEISASTYAAATALFIFTPLAQASKRQYARWLTGFCKSDGVLDVAFLKREVVPLRGPEGRDAAVLCLSLRLKDEVGPVCTKLRTAEILWRVGHIFRHRLLGYNAVIRGWDLTCELPEEMIKQMQIDTLPRGRHQPFYYIVLEDGSKGYVASENITDGPVRESTCIVFSGMHGICKYFRKLGVDSRGRPRFVKSAALEVEYPED